MRSSADAAEQLLPLHEQGRGRFEGKNVTYSEILGIGDRVPVGQIDVVPALQELFEVHALALEWNRRSRLRGVTIEMIDAAIDKDRRQAPLTAYEAWLVGVNDALVLKSKDRGRWLRRYASGTSRSRAGWDFENRWIDFLTRYGPLRGETQSAGFGALTSDILWWAMASAGTAPDVAPEEVIAQRQERIHDALGSIRIIEGTHHCPTVYSALLLAITEGRKAGVRWRHCERPSCGRMFIMTRADSSDPTKNHRHCSPACRKAAARRKADQ